MVIEEIQVREIRECLVRRGGGDRNECGLGRGGAMGKGGWGDETRGARGARGGGKGTSHAWLLMLLLHGGSMLRLLPLLKLLLLRG